MAKLEQKQAVAAKKHNKAKKRKHNAAEIEDEVVASKSLIVEPEKSEEAATKSTKSLKRKNKNKTKIKEKRAKHGEDADDGSDHETAADDNADEEELGPTLEQLRESEKPENTNAILTKRQKKKQKYQERLEAQKDQGKEKDRQRNEEYLRKWKHEKAEWKFEKLRQISIQQTVFYEDKISAEVWPIALEYLSGSMGAAKEKIVKLVEDLIDRLDKQATEKEDEAERQAVVESTEYQRARDLLQSFN